MTYLLDTCAVSELTKPEPNEQFVKWISGQDEHQFYLSVLTIGELHKGICKLPSSVKKKKLHKWLENDLKSRFQNRIINITLDIVHTWGVIQAACEKKGNPMPAVDALIAATGMTHHLTIVTRNVKDLEASGAILLNPWG